VGATAGAVRSGAFEEYEQACDFDELLLGREGGRDGAEEKEKEKEEKGKGLSDRKGEWLRPRHT
jgi:hypothetical protein